MFDFCNSQSCTKQIFGGCNDFGFFIQSGDERIFSWDWAASSINQSIKTIIPAFHGENISMICAVFEHRCAGRQCDESARFPMHLRPEQEFLNSMCQIKNK